MQHLLVCPMMNTVCSTQDLATANGIVIGCARHWEARFGGNATGGRTRMMISKKNPFTQAIQFNISELVREKINITMRKVLPLQQMQLGPSHQFSPLGC